MKPVAHTGRARLGARVRPGWFVQTHEHPELLGPHAAGDPAPRRRHRTRAGMPREPAARALDRYELAHAAEQRFESLSGGQQARFQILLLELSGATLLLLDEPTDNLDVESAEALEEGLEAFDGTVARGDPRPVVRPWVRPVPGLRRGRLGLRVRRPGVGRGPGAAGPLSRLRRAGIATAPAISDARGVEAGRGAAVAREPATACRRPRCCGETCICTRWRTGEVSWRRRSAGPAR